MRAVLNPTCLDELFQLLNQHSCAIPMAGGTDLLVRLRGCAVPDDRPLLFLEKVAELRGIRMEGKNLSIGAAETFSRIIADPLVLKHAPLLAVAVDHIGGPALRNMASIGGNVCTASPAGDSLPPLYLHDAMIEIASIRGTRSLPINAFITGPGRNALSAGEIVTRILLPTDADFPLHHVEKVGHRRSMAIAVASFAGRIRMATDGTVAEARFAWGSVAPTIVRLPALEDHLRGARLDDATIRHAAEIIRNGVAPIDDIRATADYRRSVAVNLPTRFLEGLRV